jgi:hypothetical protein
MEMVFQASNNLRLGEPRGKLEDVRVRKSVSAIVRSGGTPRLKGA